MRCPKCFDLLPDTTNNEKLMDITQRLATWWDGTNLEELDDICKDAIHILREILEERDDEKI